MKIDNWKVGQQKFESIRQEYGAVMENKLKPVSEVDKFKMLGVDHVSEEFHCNGNQFTLITEQTRGVSLIQWGKVGRVVTIPCVLNVAGATRIVELMLESERCGRLAGKEDIKSQFRTLLEIKKL